MNQSISLKLSHSELSALAFITWNVSACLLQNKNDLYRLAGLHLHKLHHRLNQKAGIVYGKTKAVRLNLPEVLSLHQFIHFTSEFDDVYTSTVRNQVFTTIDKML